MEKYTRNARFCLICNYVSKIIPALQSRCTRFRFQPLPQQFVRTRLQTICGAERCAGGVGGGGGVLRGRPSPWLRQPCLATSLTHPYHPALPPPRAPCRRSLKVTAPGVEALIELGGGDMRRTLNLLQSTCMSAGEVTEDSGAGGRRGQKGA